MITCRVAAQVKITALTICAALVKMKAKRKLLSIRLYLILDMCRFPTQHSEGLTSLSVLLSAQADGMCRGGN